ncbi:hypothetical protein NLG97_g7 [Lecanicillium saksenae]|uniref:Uncharacterized protein n=1 Tax=Lecanicillium saksenae TaxID=468837 RepID=A0ACC1R7R8_9HYPO|nr:hypothetical protein NLG97_g7 [Lecanicillium saksenae]
MRTTIVLAILPALLGGGPVQAQDVYTLTKPVNFPPHPIASGSAHASLVPFNVDFTSLPGYQNQTVLDKLATSVWESQVNIYDDGKNFLSLVSLSWPQGEGPGAAAAHATKLWNACAIVLPGVLNSSVSSAPGNGSCFDIFPTDCLHELMSVTLISFASRLFGAANVTQSLLKEACSRASQIPSTSKCFKQPSAENSVTEGKKRYPMINPVRTQPFVLGVDAYLGQAAPLDKLAAEASAFSRTWPLVILEAQGDYTVQATISCPSAGANYFRDDFADASLKRWSTYGGGYQVVTKALVGQKARGSKALINGRQFSDFSYEADITLPAGSIGDAGFIFRVTDPDQGEDDYNGYYAAIDTKNQVILGSISHSWRQIGYAQLIIQAGRTYHLKVRAKGSSLSIYVDDMTAPKIKVIDSTYARGLNGVRVYNTEARYENITISPIPSEDMEDLVPSPDGTCGGSHKYRCTGTEYFYGNCCGKTGTCSYSEEACIKELGCQPLYGLCDSVVTVTNTATVTAVPTPTPGSGYHSYGCFAFYETMFQGDYLVAAVYKLTPDACARYCKRQDRKMFAVGDGTCFCGDDMLDGILESANCNEPCQGDPKQICGGHSAANVFGVEPKPKLKP